MPIEVAEKYLAVLEQQIRPRSPSVKR